VKLTDLLRQLDACDDALNWAEGRHVDEAAWLACERGDWLMWLAVRIGVPRPLIVLAACDCARLALPLVPEGESRPLRAIEVAEAWALGDQTVSREDCWAAYAYAATASAAAAATAYASAAAAAAAATAYASAAAAAAYAASADASAAYAASADASAAAAYAASAAVARAVRERITWRDVESALDVYLRPETVEELDG
jgi:hypothetical protein